MSKAQDLRGKNAEELQGQLADLKSTLGRELFFATHHAIHHHAMMKTIGREFGIEAPAGFGTAPSTIKFETAR